MTNSDWTSTLTSGTGGVTTEEAGQVEGDITIQTFWSGAGKRALVTVRAAGGDDWYTVSGSPVEATTEEAGQAVHDATVAAARQGGGAKVSPLD
ncbi:hypothetical protein KHQ06_19795 [Nocardia tengchongensis]|uniref:DUF1508 domain-containing protein n=1 Tax=Nocardia tengchongensis TaxID=2055889 RepID=A0ABX8CFM9_9NOCA|nr:hypothetical protein [Nocardia tengchongensis]QVI18776.1 hypothetical protein KHQ06_19795 [Nocardia tengchongensis]